MPDDRNTPNPNGEHWPSVPTDTEDTVAASLPNALQQLAAARRSRKTATPELTNTVTEGIANATALTPGYTPAVWEDVTDKTRTPFAYPIGIELTMIPTLVKDGNMTTHYDDDLVARLADVLNYAFQIHKIKAYKDQRPHRDGFAIEVPSPVFENWGEVKKWYDRVAGMMIDIGCIPHHPKVTSGGGHIHVSKLSPELIRNIFRDMQNRPYLAWIFNEADDDNSAATFTEELNDLSKELRADAARVTFDPSRFGDISDEGQLALTFFSGIKPSLKWFPSDKNSMLAYRSDFKTLEFRLFEAPSNWEEQQAHIAFVQAYIQWVDAAYKDKPPVVTMFQTKTEAALTQPQCEAEFRALLTTLGLPFAPFERMVKENLTQRFQRGTRGKKNDRDDDENDDEFADD